jgi:uncharacterized protein (TIGR02588 family)
VTLALSVLVVGALIAIALVEESQRERADAGSLEVTFDRDHVAARDDAFYVPYTVRNTGSRAINAAKLWFDVYDGERVVDSAEVTVEFLPLEGKQDGLYVTTYDPATHRLQARLESVQFP